MDKQFIDEMNVRLLEEKKRLTNELSGMSEHTELGDSEEDNAYEVPIDEVNQDLMARIESDLVKIDLALQKIEDGTYGTDKDGNSIAEERLRALPWADKAI